MHSEARRFAGQDYDILLIGHQGHEEVEGTTGEAPAHVHLVDGPGDVASVRVRDPAKVVWLSQTTLSVDETIETVTALRQRFPLLADPPSDDICYATQNRQAAVKRIARDCDVLIVVGSENSSNSVRLVEVAVDAGAGAAYLVDDGSAIDEEWLKGADCVGVTSGASVPEIPGHRGPRPAGRDRLRPRRGGRGGRGEHGVRPAQGATRPAGCAAGLGIRMSERHPQDTHPDWQPPASPNLTGPSDCPPEAVSTSR